MLSKRIFQPLILALFCAPAIAAQSPESPASEQSLSVFVKAVNTMPWVGPIPWLPDSLSQPALNCDGNVPFKERPYKPLHHDFMCELPDRTRLTQLYTKNWQVKQQVEELLRKQTDFKLAASVKEADVVLWVQTAGWGGLIEKELVRLHSMRMKGARLLGVFALAVPPLAYKQIENDPAALRGVAWWEGRAIAGLADEAPLADLLNCFRQAIAKRASKNKGADFTIKLDTNLVTVPVAVRDAAGKPVNDLAKSDFRLAENGKAQEMALFNPVEERFDIALILDASRSTRNRREEMTRAARGFVEGLRPQDRAMVIASESGVCVESEFTTDREQIRRAIDGVKPYTGGIGSHRIYDSIELALTDRLKKLPGRKAIVIFTDGIGGGGFYSSADVLARASESNTPIYVILYDTHDEAARELKQHAPNTPASDFELLKEEYQKCANFLLDLSRASGGRLYRAEEMPGAPDAFAKIAEELRNQYWLSYYPRDESQTVFNRDIQITVNRPGLTVHSVKIRPDFPLTLQTGLSVGPLTARPGEKISGWLTVPELRNPDNSIKDAGTNIPISVIHGAKPGPVLALIAGNHGYEYAPIIALQRLLPQLDPKEISGTVILVHIANLHSFFARTIYYHPIDYKNLNRVYPGKADGTISERTAYQITKEVIERADYVIDLHCGDGNESLRPYSYWDTKNGGQRVIEESKQLALAFGLDHIVMDEARPSDPDRSTYCSTTAVTRGKPAISIESGGLGATDNESIANIERGALSVMRHLKMIAGQPQMVARPFFIDRNEVLLSEREGIFYPLVEKGQTVAKDALMGYITDFHGQRVAELRAPFAGTVLYIVATPPTRRGEPLAMIGHIKEGEK